MLWYLHWRVMRVKIRLNLARKKINSARHSTSNSSWKNRTFSQSYLSLSKKRRSSQKTFCTWNYSWICSLVISSRNLKCRIQAEDYKAVRTLLQTTTDMLRHQQSYKNKYLDPKYLCEMPLVEPEWPEESFVPIFPKSRRPQSGMKNPQGNPPGLQDFTDLPGFIPRKVDVDDLDEDVSRQNLIVVDGWRMHHLPRLIV